MAYTQSELMELILDTKAVKIWNHKTGPVFWYAAGVPGPFYVNTEQMLGAELANKLLEEITTIVGSTNDGHERAVRLRDLMMDAYNANPAYATLVDTLIEKLKKSYPEKSYDLISGGERRDWLFSIPLAEKMGYRHAYLFKNFSTFSFEPFSKGERVLHVSDLVNNGSSHFDTWFPTLEKAELVCAGSLCVNTRGANGITRLAAIGQKVVALCHIDLTFFEQCCEKGLLDLATLDELRVFFASTEEWASRYLLSHENESLYDVPHLDKKSKERMASFFTKDPWNVKNKHQAFFEKMRRAASA